MTPHLYPIHISAIEKLVIIQLRAQESHTWVFAPGSYQPSPWLRLDSLFQTKPHDLDEFIKEHPPMNQPEMTRFLKMLYTHFGLDTRIIHGIMDTDNPIGTACYRANIIAYRYCFHPIERFTALSRATHPAWSTVNVYRNCVKGSDAYYRHRSAYLLGHALVENWGGMKPNAVPGADALLNYLPSVGKLVLVRSGRDRKASIDYNHSLGAKGADGVKALLDSRTQAIAMGPTGLQKLLNEGLERFKLLLVDPTLGPAISYYLYRLKGELACVETDGRITLGLEVLLFLATGQLGKAQMGSMSHSIPAKGAQSAEYIGPFTLGTMQAMHALASSLYKTDMEIRQEEALLLKPQGLVPMPIEEYNDLIIRLLMPADKAKTRSHQFVVTSADGSYNETRTIKDDLIEGDEYIDLEYKNLPVSQLFTFKKVTKHSTTTYFTNVSYQQLSQKGEKANG